MRDPMCISTWEAELTELRMGFSWSTVEPVTAIFRLRLPQHRDSSSGDGKTGATGGRLEESSCC